MAHWRRSENEKQNKFAPTAYLTGKEDKLTIEPEKEIVVISDFYRPHEYVEILFEDFRKIYDAFETALFDHTMDLSPNPKDDYDPNEPDLQIYFQNRRGVKMLPEVTWTVIPNTQMHPEEEYRLFKYGKDEVELQIVPLTPRKLRPRKDFFPFFPVILGQGDFYLLAQINKYILRHPDCDSSSRSSLDSSVSSLSLVTDRKECDLCESSDESSEFETETEYYDSSSDEDEEKNRELPSILGRMAMAARSLVKVLDTNPPPRKKRRKSLESE